MLLCVRYSGDRNIACAAHVVNECAYVCVFARCAYITWYRRALLVCVCVCFVLFDKHCDAGLFISFKFQRPYAIVADEFKKHRHGCRTLVDVPNGGSCQLQPTHQNMEAKLRAI